MNALSTLAGWFTPTAQHRKEEHNQAENYEMDENHPLVLAAKETTDPVEQLRFAYHPNGWVVWGVATNRHLTLNGVFARLLNYDNEHIRWAAITHVNLPTDLLVAHLTRLDPQNNANDALDFSYAVHRQQILQEAGLRLQPDVVEVLHSQGYSV